MSATAILLIVAIAFIFVLLAYIWWLHRELDSLSGSHARPRERAAAASALPDGAAPADQRPAGSAPAPEPPVTALPPTAPQAEGGAFWDDARPDVGPEPVPDSLMWHAQTAAAEHANKMWQASEPYLPPLPKRPTGVYARKADLTRTAGAPPWETETAAQDAVTDEQMRAEYFAPGRHELQQIRDELAGRFIA